MLGMLAASGVLAADLEVTYTTKTGDTLIGLQKQLLATPFSWKGIMVHNRIADPLRIPVGSLLRIPEGWLRSEPRTARVSAVRGDVSLDGHPLVVDERVPAGALLRTGQGAFVTLIMPDESRLTVQPGSEARLEKVQGFSGLAGQNTQVLLERGRVETAVSAQKGPAARYQIRTPTATIAVRGTAFRVGAEPDSGVARAEVTGGEVQMSGAGSRAPTALPAGFGVAAKPGEPIPVPRPLLPAPNLDSAAAPYERGALAFAFAAVDKATGYRAQIARDQAFADLVADAVVSASPARFSDVPDGRYWLRVRAIDGDGIEGLDALRAIEVRARPEAPAVTAPGASGRGQVSFAWSAAAEAARYRLQLSRDAAFTAPVLDRETEVLEARVDLPPGEYQWRIASVRANGERGPWSETRSVAVHKPLGVPVLTRYNNRLRFSWAGSPGQMYDFELARDAAFTNIVLTQRIGEAALTIPAPSSGLYYLRVRGIEPDGTVGAYTGVQKLGTVPFLPWILSAPEATSP